MTDVSHELGSLRFVVDSPLSSKVAMFNKQVSSHQEAQSLNPFSQPDGRASPKRSFAPGEYGKPLAGSLTEMRGQKANIHVLKEMLELCQIIDSEGYKVNDEPDMRVIPFGELFHIYTYISDKVVGILLRARKHKLVEFEGECLFQRRDDHVPVFLLKPIKEIRQILHDKQEEIKRSVSPAPQATSVLLDKKSQRAKSPASSKPPKKETTDNSLPSEQKIIPAPASDATTLSVPSLTSSRPPTPTIVIKDENNTEIKDVPEEAAAIDISTVESISSLAVQPSESPAESISLASQDSITSLSEKTDMNNNESSISIKTSDNNPANEELSITTA